MPHIRLTERKREVNLLSLSSVCSLAPCPLSHRERQRHTFVMERVSADLAALQVSEEKR